METSLTHSLPKKQLADHGKRQQVFLDFRCEPWRRIFFPQAQKFRSGFVREPAGGNDLGLNEIMTQNSSF